MPVTADVMTNTSARTCEEDKETLLQLGAGLVWMTMDRKRKSLWFKTKSRSAEDIETAVQDKRKNADRKFKELMNLPAGEIKLWGMDMLRHTKGQGVAKRPNSFSYALGGKSIANFFGLWQSVLEQTNGLYRKR